MFTPSTLCHSNSLTSLTLDLTSLGTGQEKGDRVGYDISFFVHATIRLLISFLYIVWDRFTLFLLRKIRNTLFSHRPLLRYTRSCVFPPSLTYIRVPDHFYCTPLYFTLGCDPLSSGLGFDDLPIGFLRDERISPWKFNKIFKYRTSLDKVSFIETTTLLSTHPLCLVLVDSSIPLSDPPSTRCLVFVTSPPLETVSSSSFFCT